MFRTMITIFCVLWAAMPARADVDPDLGLQLSELFLAGETEAIWAQMASKMQSALGDAAKLNAFSQQVQIQAGSAGEVINEEWSEEQGFDIFRRIQNFENSPQPLVFHWTFDAKGQIAGFFVRPQQGEPSQAFEDYQTRTELRVPFSGEWFVFWGGRERAQNYHVDAVDQRYAYDILVIRNGKSFEGDPLSLDSYFCFGQEILTPAGGTVVAAVDGLPDQVPGQMDSANPPGNHVIINHGNEEYSLLAHFQQGSVAVKEGDVVEAGQLLGLCGNSGNTSEPHLHYHLQNADTFGHGHGLPAPFSSYMADGEKIPYGELVKGQVISPCDDCE